MRGAVTDLPYVRIRYRTRVCLPFVDITQQGFSFYGGSHCMLSGPSTPVGYIADHFLCRRISVAASSEQCNDGLSGLEVIRVKVLAHG